MMGGPQRGEEGRGEKEWERVEEREGRSKSRKEREKREGERGEESDMGNEGDVQRIRKWKEVCSNGGWETGGSNKKVPDARKARAF